MLHVCCPPVAGEFGVDRGLGLGGKLPGERRTADWQANRLQFLTKLRLVGDASRSAWQLPDGRSPDGPAVREREGIAPEGQREKEM